MTDYNDGNWHHWGRPAGSTNDGKPGEIHPKSILDAFWVDSAGSIFYDQGVKAEHVIFPFVVTFRVVKEHREPREFWITYQLGTLLVFPVATNYPRDEAIHVREVLE